MMVNVVVFFKRELDIFCHAHQSLKTVCFGHGEVWRRKCASETETAVKNVIANNWNVWEASIDRNICMNCGIHNFGKLKKLEYLEI